ncbi:hypothetical protein Ciccas_012177 [Cichlidogyrus casuarinus]|uniref:G-protein coupled receptors family 1 profile domain-containing protein n=1 Tax=Cichlidogyrus casuarinus TaxID=1844966 RepID=A0ABD2PQX2_9PLAT
MDHSSNMSGTAEASSGFRLFLDRRDMKNSSNFSCQDNQTLDPWFNYLGMSLCVINFIANVFVYTAFRRISIQKLSPATRPNTSLLLLFQILSIVEMAFLASWLLQDTCHILFKKGMIKIPLKKGSPQFIALFYLFSAPQVILTAFHITRNLTVTLITIIRFLSVFRSTPNQSRVFTKSRVLFTAICINMVAFLISLPRLWSWTFIICTQDDESPIYVRGGKPDKYWKTHYNNIYTLATLFIFQNGGPAIIICVLGVCIMRKISRRNQTSKSTAKKKLSGNVLVAVLCVGFVIFEIPSFIAKVFNIYSMDATKKEIIRNLANLATLLDSTFNVLIYFLSNKLVLATINQRFNKRANSLLRCSNNQNTIFKKISPQEGLQTVEETALN